MRNLIVLFLFSAALVSCSTKNPDLKSKEASSYFKVSLVQYEIEGNQSFPRMIEKMEDSVRIAREAQAQVVVFPEYLIFDMLRESSFEDEKLQVRKIAQNFDTFMNEMLRLAKVYDLHILAGTTPRLVGGRLYNVAPFIFPDGRAVFQNKIFLTPWEKKHGFASGTEIQVLQGAWGNAVILICYDIESPLLSVELSDWKPDLIFVPSMTESEEGLQRVKRTAAARAVEHHSYVLVASGVGRPQPKWRIYGESYLFAPQDAGFQVKEPKLKSEHTELIHLDLELEGLKASRSQTGFWPIRDVGPKRNLIRVRSANPVKWKRPVPSSQ